MTVASRTPPASPADDTAIVAHDLASDEDWWCVRDLLVRTHARAPVDWNWEIRRWDGKRYRYAQLGDSPIVQRGVRIWRKDGAVVGAAHSEGDGDAFFQLDPDFRFLEPQMLDWAEEFLAAPADDKRLLRVYAQDYDIPRRELLSTRGYLEQASGGWVRIVRFGGEIPPDPLAPLPPGYELATTGAQHLAEDAARMAKLIGAAFGREGDYAPEYLTFMCSSPSFRHRLNLVAVAEDGSFASHVGVTYDHVNRFGIFEPVCTHPDHQRRGLARALTLEGMRRLRALGATSACVGSGDAAPANSLYRACGFHEEYRGHWWHKTF
jgi:ribosomal protein S18 acetylase RimI-like enzyme